MAASILPISTTTINWAARNLSLEYNNYGEMCALMFDGPLAEHKDNDKAKFSYMSLWGGPKALELFRNSALCNQKTSKNLLLVLKDYCKPSNNIFWSSRMEMRNLSLLLLVPVPYNTTGVYRIFSNNFNFPKFVIRWEMAFKPTHVAEKAVFSYILLCVELSRYRSRRL